MPEPTKTCTKCNVSKPVGAFTTHAGCRMGVRPDCKDCRTLILRRWSEANPEKTLGYQRAYREANREKKNACAKKWQKQHLSATQAHGKVAHAIKDGRLVRPKACPRCGNPSHLHAHHADYARPLDVEWLCSRCHKRLHAVLRKA